MLDPNIKLSRQPGFGAFIRELAEAPLDEINAKLGTQPDMPNGDLRRPVDTGPYKFIPSLLPLSAGTSSASHAEDRRLRMIADTRDAFTAFEDDQDTLSGDTRRIAESQTGDAKSTVGQRTGPDGADVIMQPPQSLRSTQEAAPVNIVDPELQNVLLSLATAANTAAPRQISTARTVMASIAATLLIMAAAWVAVRLL